MINCVDNKNKCVTVSITGVEYHRGLIYRGSRSGVKSHSQADIGNTQRLLGYAPQYRIYDGIETAMPWYLKNCEGK